MAKFLYKTRANSTPHGKPKVYFCCHPKDFKKYFDTISNDILDISNCSVWYPENLSQVRDEDFLDNLSQVQLFVVPVTTAFLTKSCDAYDIDFKIAQEYHIPVLPLLQEMEAVTLFNEKCGNMQYLSNICIDETSLGYYEKLTSYLEKVLVGDELAKKIRSAFDAYIFLSYRKTDRKYARELMKLIHSDDFCRDIAIWYDEYIIPGEDFNTNIKEALKNCDLFMLALTPNIIADGNYVLTIEYPLAKEKNKPILPVECEPVDIDILSRAYKDFPPYIKIGDHDTIPVSIADAMFSLDFKTSDRRPEHNFLIGLAYLNGIDVEVDHDRGVELITSAAEAGYLEAVDQLIKMHTDSIGVSADIKEVIYWTEKKLEILEKQYKKSPSCELYDEMFWTANRLGDYALAQEELEDANKYYYKALEISKPESALDFSADVAVCLDHIGDVYLTQGKYDEAEKLFCEAGNIFKKIYKDNPSDYGNFRNLLLNIFFLTTLYSKTGDTKISIECLLGILPEIEEAATEDLVVIKDLASVYEKLGELYSIENETEKAIEYSEKAYDRFCAIANQERSLLAYSKSNNALRKLIELYAGAGKAVETVELLQNQYETAIKLYNSKKNIQTMHYFILAATNYLGICIEPQKKIKVLEKEIKVLKEILKISENPENIMIFFTVAADLTGLYISSKQFNEAKALIKSVIPYMPEDITDNETSLKIAGRVSVIYDCWGEIFSQEGNLPKAREYYDKALDILVKLTEASDDSIYKKDLAVCYRKIGLWYDDQNKPLETIQYFEKSLEIEESLKTDSTDLNDISILAVCCYMLGLRYTDIGNKEVAFDYHLKALGHYEFLKKNNYSESAGKYVARAIADLSSLAVDNPRLTKRLMMYVKKRK